MMVQKRRDETMASLQRSTLTYPVDHTVFKPRVNAHRLFPMRELRISYLYMIIK